jgi:N-acetylglucosaminyldiphosphoundecaprenol N-acetyl-beta-D-mannosaminyltransferase
MADSERFRARLGTHVWVGPVPVLNGDLNLAVSLLNRALEEGHGATVATANMDFIAQARKDRDLKRRLAASDMVVADGAPVAWLARARGAQRVSRIAGVDLVEALLDRPGVRVALYGSTPRKASAAAEVIERGHPGASITLVLCPPFRKLTAQEVAAEQRDLEAAAPDLVLVALGCPKQEALIERYRHVARSAVWIGVGGTFDFLAGHRRRAPRWMQRLGLEWAARLAQEPRRLSRRYLANDLPVLALLALQTAWPARANVDRNPTSTS